MAWRTSDRRSRLPADWPARVAAVKRRDAGTCRRCGAAGTDVDHVIAGDDHELGNLQLLCRPCHRDKTQREAAAGRTRAARRRPQTETHPGKL